MSDFALIPPFGGTSVISTLYMPSYSTVVFERTARSPAFDTVSYVLRQSLSNVFFGLPSSFASAAFPSAVKSASVAGRASSFFPCDVTCSGSPAAPTVMLRPHIETVAPLSLTGVHGASTFSGFPAFVPRKGHFFATSMRLKEPSIVRIFFPPLPMTSVVTL